MNITFRDNPKKEDIENIRNIVLSTGFFYDYEIDIAVELIEDKINNPEGSSYKFIFAEIDGKTIAYSCYGLISCTKYSYDLYWIATHNDFRNSGIGKEILKLTEEKISEEGGMNVYAETSSMEKYLPTRKFYEKNGYLTEGIFKDFYNIDDDKVVFVKRLKHDKK